MKILSKAEYEQLVKQQELASKNNDYSKMIMSGDDNDIAMKKYYRDHLCEHKSIRSEQGGQIDICNLCGKTWR